MSDTDKKYSNNMHKRFSDFFKEVGITQEEFSNKIGVARSAISSWKNGVHSPSGTALKMMETEFNLNPIWLLNGEGKMFLTQREIERDVVTNDAFEFARKIIQNPIIRELVERLLSLDKKSLEKIQAYLDGMEGK